jgi:hypothetical protein
MLRGILAFLGAIGICAAVTEINRDYLRYMMRPFPADDYEVFVYSLVEVGPFIFGSAAFTIFHALNLKRPRDRFSKCAVIIGFVCVLLAFAADVLFMPRVRFR